MNANCNTTNSLVSFCLAVFCLGLSGCGEGHRALLGPHDEATQSQLEPLFRRANHALFRNRCSSATLFGVSEEDAGLHYADRLEAYSPRAEAEFRASMRRILGELEQFEVDDAQEEEDRRVIADIVGYYAGAEGIEAGFIDTWMGHSPFVVNQINGPLIDIPNLLLNSHQIADLADAEDYLKRLKAFGQMAETVRQKVDEDAANGWMPPRIIIEKSLSYLNDYTGTPIEENTLLVNLAEKIDALDDVDPGTKQGLLDAARLAIETSVYPGFRHVSERLTGLLPYARAEAGIWAQPQGEAFYRYSVTSLGDTDLTPDEIHQTGLAEVARITVEMDAILRQQGYTEGSVGKRMARLNEESRFLYANDDRGRAELLRDLNTYIEEIRVRMPAWFASVPPYPVEVRRIPVATEASSAGGYYTPPTLDGGVPGIYWINLRDTKTNPTFDLKTLTYHEAIPGHHWQIALNLAQQDLPLLRRIASYNAYIEGWALYCEQLAYEMGMYENDAFGNLGRLKGELFRAVRLVVDTGIHYKRWTREQAIDYMAGRTGITPSDVVSEIERYMVWPGQALGYKLGMLKMLSLRESAHAELGEAFDLRAFHDLVLLGGAVPMKVLEAKVVAWLEARRQRPVEN